MIRLHDTRLLKAKSTPPATQELFANTGDLLHLLRFSILHLKCEKSMCMAISWHTVAHTLQQTAGTQMESGLFGTILWGANFMLFHFLRFWDCVLSRTLPTLPEVCPQIPCSEIARASTKHLSHSWSHFIPAEACSTVQPSFLYSCPMLCHLSCNFEATSGASSGCTGGAKWIGKKEGMCSVRLLSIQCCPAFAPMLWFW